MLIDYHMHTTHSVDGHATLRDMCERAIDEGLTEIAVTDHLDGNPCDPGVGMFSAERFFEEYREVVDALGDRLTIRAGLEIGEPHEYRDTVEELAAWPFDVVIGSVHYIGPHGVHEDLFDAMPLETALEAYLDSQLQIARSGLVDVLGHLDYFQRYTLIRDLPPFDPERFENPIRDVLRAVIENGLALEVNTSGLRQKPGVCFPDRMILSWYHDMGGRAVTVGSDAHYLDHVGANIRDGMGLLREIGFESVAVYRRRRLKRIPLRKFD
ncbi:MAG: histidinol-phosphatase HisJ family protein [Phycisphaerae bacterium]|nr:histidinol-phosphatase HisJ family protein [Phycisphaerae bacterium]